MKNYPSVLPPFAGVAWSTQAQCLITPGPTIDEIMLQLTNCVVADVVNVTMTVNGETILSLTGPQLNFLAAFRGLPTSTGFLPIRFADIAMKTLDAQNLTGLVTLLSDIIMLNVTLGAYGGGGTAPTPSITGELHTSKAQQSRWLMPYQMATAQNAILLTDQILNIPSGFNYHTIHMIGQGSGVSRLQVFRQKNTGNTATPGSLGVKLWDRQLAMNNYQLSRAGRVPQTFGGVPAFHFDPVSSGYAIASALNVPATDALTLDYNNAATGVVTVIQEYTKQIGPNPHAQKAPSSASGNARQ